MLRPRWRKVLRDLLSNKTRTFLVVLSIAVGVMAIGTVMSSQRIIASDLPQAFAAINPTSATVYALNTFDDDIVENVERLPQVEDAAGKRQVVTPFLTARGDWRNLNMIAIPDFENITINQLKPEEGEWPPPEGTILIERSALAPNLGFEGVGIGDSITVKAPNGNERSLRIVGTLHDLNQFPPQIAQTPFGYVSFETLELLGEPAEYNLIEFVVAENELYTDFKRGFLAENYPDAGYVADRLPTAVEKEAKDAYTKQVSDIVQEELEKSNVSVIFVLAFPPGEHPAQSFLDSISALLIAMGGLALVLGGFLIVNTLAAILAQQVRQIGIMKAIGGRTNQLSKMYFAMVLIFGLLALIIAIPLGAFGGSLLAGIFAGFLNFDVSGFNLDPLVVSTQVVIGLAVPLIAAIYPILKGTRTTVREAISEHGMGKGQFGTSLIDTLIVGLKSVIPMQRPAQISLRNTFRRKGRLILTLITLSLASVIFISVMTIRDSLQDTLNEALSYFDYEVQVRFSRPYRIEPLLREAEAVPGVLDAESWGFGSARRVRPDESEGDNIIIYAPPADSNMIQPTILEGRWLRESDRNAIVINTEMVSDEPDVGLGSIVTLKIGSREQEWVVVGIARSSIPQPNIFINYDTYSRVVNEVGQGQVVLAKVDESQYTQDRAGSLLETHFRDRGYRVEEMQTVEQARQIISLFFNIPIIFLLAMAGLLGFVGGLGLMGTMSINVIERLREVGVMRAIGASDWSVLRIVLLEGTIIGLISWFVGGLLAFPLSRLLTNLVGTLLLSAEPAYTFSYWGTGLWLFIVIVLAIVASFLPARSASRVTVREVLSYE